MNSRKTLLNLTVNFLKFSFDGIGYCQSAVDLIIFFSEKIASKRRNYCLFLISQSRADFCKDYKKLFNLLS